MDRRNAAIALGVVLGASLAGWLLRFSFGVYLEPYAVTREWHLWQLFTWIPAGASLTFLAHAALLAFAGSRGVKPVQWAAVTFIAGALTTLLGFAIPAILSCTFTGAGVSASAGLSAWAATIKGPRRLAATALALMPAALDALVDGLYVLVPFGFAFIASGLWVRWSRRAHKQP